MINLSGALRDIPPLVQGPANLLDTSLYVGKFTAWDELENGLGERRIRLTFFVKDPQVHQFHRLYHNLLTRPNTSWRWVEFAKAFRITDWADAGDLIGQSCRLGIRKRQHPWRESMVNTIVALHPLTDDLPVTEVEPECTGCCKVHCV